MKIRTKIVLLLTLGVLAPMLLSHHFISMRTAATVRATLERELSAEAAQTAGRVNDRMIWAAEGLGLVVQSMPFESLSAADLGRALALPYRQLTDASIVALLDEGGKALAPPYRPDAAEAVLLRRAPVSDADLRAFSRHVPLEAALAAKVAFGPPYRSDEGEPRIVGASSFRVASGERRWVLAVELSLRALCGEVVAAGASGGGRGRRLLDAKGFPICAPPGEPWAPVPDAAAVLGQRPGTIFRRGAGEAAVLAASADVSLTGWRLEAGRSEPAVMAPLASLRKWIFVWTGAVLVLAIAGGILLSRGLTGPIAELEEASREIAGGAYERVLAVRSDDEVGGLARSFNRMTAEIRAWNAELTARVEARTRELREAQQQILQSQKLAAVGELGAGVAHEINNPLTGVIGLAQLARADAAPGTELAATLDDIVANARRVAEVVDALLRFSQTQVAPDMAAVDPGRVLDEVLSMYAGRIADRGIAVERRLEGPCEISAVEGDLRIALTHLVDNAVRAMPDGGRLGLEVARVEGGAVRISIEDGGAGMAAEVLARASDPFFSTRPPGSGSKGLGLWIAHRVVEDHGGRIVLESAEGRGTTATLYFPGKARLSKA